MKRIILGLFVSGLFFGIALLAGLGVIITLSGGNVTGFIQTELIRFRLSNRQTELNMPVGTDNTPRRFTIDSGQTPPVVADNLLYAGLISDPDLFIDYLRLEGLDTQIEAGTYFLNQTQTIPQIALNLIDSRSSSITFRVFEGSRIEEIAAVIDAIPLFGFSGDAFLQIVGPGAQIDPALTLQLGIPAGASLEGFMFPDTYVLPPDISPGELRDTLLDNFIARIGPELFQAASNQNLTMRQVVTIASIVERESVWEDENAMIAGVYRNRLNIGMKLDADPTVQYGLNGSRGSWWPNITQADYVNVQSVYNTYLTTGLPPGPIANPGQAAIEAALFPAQSDYFYFRARCDGSSYHDFSRNYDEHLAKAC